MCTGENHGTACARLRKVTVRETFLWDCSDNDVIVTDSKKLTFDPHVQEVPKEVPIKEVPAGLLLQL